MYYLFDNLLFIVNRKYFLLKCKFHITISDHCIILQERRRTQSTRGISWINQRNRQAMKDAVFSGQLHIEASSEYDPFTRKNARTKVKIHPKRWN